MIEIDLTYFYQFLAQFEGQSTFGILYILLFKYWLWVLFVYIVLRYLIYPEYRLYIGGKWASKQPGPVILAIDVPKRNEQSIQAMENFFDHLQGAHSTFTKWGEYIEGEFQRSLSVELVSIEGNIQFLIRCPGDWRNLVEAAVYSQFPDAEITEVEDYVNSVPKDYPNDTHDIWGVEFTLSANPLIPLKSWQKFEHRFSETFVDPMAALLETMSSIGPGEQIWIQYLLTPLAVDWGIKKGREEVDKILGKAAPSKPSMFSGMFKLPASIINEFTEQLAGVNLSGEGAEEKKQDNQSTYQFLTSAQKDIVDGIEAKTSKWAFNTKIRYLYVYEKDKGNKAVGVNGVIGSIKQWTDVNTNGLKPDLKTTGTSSPQYILIDYRRKIRKNRLIRAYINRDTVIGSPAKPMCSEELASLWHFPSMYVKAPLLKKTEFTKAAAPVGLPIQEEVSLKPVEDRAEQAKEETPEEEKQFQPTFDYDSDDFEKQFAKDKDKFKKTRPAREERLAEIAKEEEENFKKIKKQEAEQKQAQETQKETQATKTKEEKKDSESDKSTGAIPGNIPFID
jgi:hypothetical protein